MAIRTGDGKRILLLLLFIVLLFGAGILLIDFVGTVFGVYFPVPGLKYLKQLSFKKILAESEDPLLLEKEELGKNSERLVLIEEQLMIREKEIEKMELETKKKLEFLKEREEELTKKSKLLIDKKNQFNDRQENVREQAIKLYNMPPRDAVSLLEKQSDSDVVDILRAIDAYSEEIGRQSTSPYLIKLLGDINKDKAANIVRKLKYSAGTNDSAVDVLEENELDFEEPPQP